MSKGKFFDEIIEYLDNEADLSKYTDIAPEILAELFSSKEKIPKMSKEMAIKKLEETVAKCKCCKLHKERLNTVFGTGSLNAELMFIGEGPGREEDEQGLPFVGKAGQLLTKMINAMQFKRPEVYIANIVKCRPPNNRNPEDDEIKECCLYLQKQIEFIQPKVLVLLGAVPVKTLLEKTGITKTHGIWHEYMGIKTMPTFHPAYLLRNPEAKKDAWEDLKKVMEIFHKNPLPKNTRFSP